MNIQFSSGETNAPPREELTPNVQNESGGNDSLIGQIQDILTLSDTQFYKDIINQSATGRGETRPYKAEEFVSLIKGFHETVEEVEAQLTDKNRIPPSLMRVIRELTSRSLSPDPNHNVDKLV